MEKEIEKLFDQLESAKQQGDLDGEIAVWRQLISISQQFENREFEIKAMRRLGNLYQDKGQLQMAHAYRLTAVDLAEDPLSNCSPKEFMYVIGDLGRSFLESKDWSKAESYTCRALEMAKEQNDQMAKFIYKINMQLVLGSTGRESQALQLAEEVLRDAETLVNESETQKSYILGLQHLNLAEYKLYKLQLNESLHHAYKALAYSEKAQNSLMRLRAQQTIGKCYVRARLLTGRRDYSAEGERYLYETIRIGQMGGDSRIIAEAESELGQLYEFHRNSEKALLHYQYALDSLEAVRSGLGYEEFQLAYFRTMQPIYENAIAFFLKHNKLGLAFHALERLRSRLLLMYLGEKRISSEEWSPEAQKQLDNVTQTYGLLAMKLIYSDGMRGKHSGITLGGRANRRGEVAEITSSELIEAHQSFIRLYDAHRVQRAHWTKYQSPQVAGLKDAQSILGPDDALLIYWAACDSLIIFALTQKDIHFQHLTYTLKQLEGDVKEIAREIFALQNWLLDPLTTDEWFGRSEANNWPTEIAKRMERLTRRLEEAYALLVAPVLSVVDERKHWIIIPNGPLHQLPWAALRTPRQYLIEKHSICLLPSTSSGLALKNRMSVKGGKALFLADPDSDDWALRLPFSQVEVRAAYQLFKAGPEPFIGQNATKTNLKEHLESVRLLHLACHHVFNASIPQLSFLKLAGSSGADNLYAFEISELSLTAELVSLSSCQSGLSHVETGDEQYGIVRAFLAAGAQSVISTLWSIEDESAATFFAQFYRMARQQSLGEAMRQAQLYLLKDPRYCLPSFWAPYTLSGCWNKLLDFSHNPVGDSHEDQIGNQPGTG